MLSVIKFELENNTLPDYVKTNVGCVVNNTFIGIGTTPYPENIFITKEDLVDYLDNNNYGDNWGPRADGTTPIMSNIDFAQDIFSHCEQLNNVL